VGGSRTLIGRVEVGFDWNIFVLGRVDFKCPDGRFNAGFSILGTYESHVTDIRSGHGYSSIDIVVLKDIKI
jgi:hypothetical protein